MGGANRFKILFTPPAGVKHQSNNIVHTLMSCGVPPQNFYGTCADLLTYYNSCVCCIWGGICIDKTKGHSKQYEGKCEHKNVIISNIQVQMICDIPVLFGNGILIAIPYTYHTWQQVSYFWVIDMLCQPTRELSTSEGHHLYRICVLITWRNRTFKTILWIIFSFFQTISLMCWDMSLYVWTRASHV